jgi:hypothetical protein
MIEGCPLTPAYMPMFTKYWKPQEKDSKEEDVEADFHAMHFLLYMTEVACSIYFLGSRTTGS